MTPQPEALQCLEVWGGNRITNQVVRAANISIAIHARPHGQSEQGGDIHYVSACSADSLIRIALADISGHGETSGQLAQGLHHLMRANIENTDHTGFVRTLNEEFGKLSTEGNFATAIIAAYYKPNNSLVLSNAGHPRPLWFRAADKMWLFLDNSIDNALLGIADAPLGVIDGTDYSQIGIIMAPGDFIVMYSDSLIESENAEGQPLHEEGLLNLVAQLPTNEGWELCDAVIDAVSAYRGHAPADDDESVLVISRPNA
ncbi:MAG: PP2C family protein-serine/threonine phosphatase [Rhodospirillaceae bacterium]